MVMQSLSNNNKTITGAELIQRCQCLAYKMMYELNFKNL